MTQRPLIDDLEDGKYDPSECEEIKGTVERITFRNVENGYTVARFKLDGAGESNESKKIRRTPDGSFQTITDGLYTIVGRFPSINEGEHLTITGKWTEHEKFGLQFEVLNSHMSAPPTLRGMEKYLSSGLVAGIGPVYAKKIVNHFKGDVFEVIEETPERLREVPGIGKKRAESLAESFRQQKSIRDVMIFLQDHDISPIMAVKIYKEYGDDSIRVLHENPYTLADDIFGVGFKTADNVAQKLGKPKDDPNRYRAGIKYMLGEASKDGHCYYPREGLLSHGSELLDADVNDLDDAIKYLVQTEAIYDDSGRIYLRFLYDAESQIAEILARLSVGKAKKSDRDILHQKIDQIQRVEKIDLAAQQIESVAKAFENQCLVITGGPGTGKSTTVRVIVRLFEQLQKNVRLASPTGRAAKRLEEACGRPASTIHRLLEYHPQQGFGRNADIPLDCKVLIVDEASMLDVPLMYYLLRALPGDARLILVGDVDQLPSVGPGTVLKDIIDSGIVPVVMLTEIFRQAAGSLIVKNAHRINNGLGPKFDPEGGEKDFRWQSEEDKNIIGDLVIRSIKEKLSKDFNPLDDIQVLTPMHAGSVGARELNRRLQETCNPPSPSKAEIKVGDRLFRLGDRVMQTKNNYELEVYNGELGRIVNINAREDRLVIEYDRPVQYRRSDLDELVLAYAITVHKSQGSEYPCVVFPITTAHWIMLQRNLLYTGITRAKKFCLLIGQRKALYRAIKNTQTAERFTSLRARLMEKASS
jgi:exodeoxyribonuclease V alpha subunit